MSETIQIDRISSGVPDTREPYDEHEDTTQEVQLVDEAAVREHGTLRVIRGAEVGALLSIPATKSLIVGRGKDADVRLSDRGLSRRHARFFQLGGTHYVEDLDSRNGVQVEGERIERLPRELRHGDRVVLGAGIVLVFELHDDASKKATEELYRKAVRDGLTGLYNRRYLDERLGQELAFAARHEQPVSAIMIDLDHFKAVNDEHGHAVGDLVLRSVARVLTEAVRSEDIVARYGGEEMCVIARGTSTEGARTLGERLRRNIACLPIRKGSVTLTVTASFGVATSAGGIGDDLLCRADAALYAAKEGGRNRCIHAQDLPSDDHHSGRTPAPSTQATSPSNPGEHPS